MKQEIQSRFLLREILPEEIEQAIAIEQICFPPHEACSPASMRERIAEAPEVFLVAVDREAGKLAGFLNGIATRERAFRDAFFTDAKLHDRLGDTVMLLGLDVLPQYRRQGLAKAIVDCYLARERERGRKKVILTCLAEKVGMYERMGFHNEGISESVWGAAQWYEMSYAL